jgi:Tfp pilus assembly protein PilF
MVRRVVVLAFALAVLSICSLAQMDPMYQRPGGDPPLLHSHDDANSISGTVITSDGKPLKDAHVELRDASGSVVTSTYTNAGGSFEFSRVSSGFYEVVATSGLQQAQQRVDASHMPSPVELRLPVSSAPRDGNPANSVSVAEYKVPGKARDELKKAREASEKGKNDEAEKDVAKALEIYPKYADALTMRAILKMDSKDEDGAIADLQQAITDDENCALAYLVMGAALNLQSKFDDAIRALERGEALSPNSWQAYFEMGKSLVGKAQYQDALRQLDRAQSLMPREYPPLHLVKAHAMLALSDYTDAMAELQQYLAKEPNGPNTQEAQKMLAQARAFAATQSGNR